MLTVKGAKKRKVIKTLRAGERRNARSSNIIPGFNLSSNSENNGNEIKSMDFDNHGFEQSIEVKFY